MLISFWVELFDSLDASRAKWEIGSAMFQAPFLRLDVDATRALGEEQPARCAAEGWEGLRRSGGDPASSKVDVDRLLRSLPPNLGIRRCALRVPPRMYAALAQPLTLQMPQHIELGNVSPRANVEVPK